MVVWNIECFQTKYLSPLWRIKGGGNGGTLGKCQRLRAFWGPVQFLGASRFLIMIMIMIMLFYQGTHITEAFFSEALIISGVYIEKQGGDPPPAGNFCRKI